MFVFFLATLVFKRPLTTGRIEHMKLAGFLQILKIDCTVQFPISSAVIIKCVMHIRKGRAGATPQGSLISAGVNGSWRGTRLNYQVHAIGIINNSVFPLIKTIYYLFMYTQITNNCCRQTAVRINSKVNRSMKCVLQVVLIGIKLFGIII